MKPFFPLLCLFTLLGHAALLPPTLRSAPVPATVNPPGTQEVYGGTVCEYSDAAADGSPDVRWGSVQVVIVDGTITGHFTFPGPSGATETSTTECHGYLDPTTNRGFLKIDAPGNTPSEKVPLLLRQGALTGGTMDADSRVLAFRLEKFLVVLP